MEKVHSIRKGNIWLNVFKTDDGETLVSLTKTYRDKDGNWNRTPFINPRRGEVKDILACIDEYHEFEKLGGA